MLKVHLENTQCIQGPCIGRCYMEKLEKEREEKKEAEEEKMKKEEVEKKMQKDDPQEEIEPTEVESEDKSKTHL